MAASTLPLAEWHDFYLALATAAATFAGLLFVSVSINVDHLRSAAGERTLRAAGRTFGVLVLLVFLALVALIPVLDATALGVTLAAAGLQGLVRVVASARVLWSEQPWRAVVLPLVAYLGLAGDAVVCFTDPPHALPLLVAPVSFLLTSAAGLSWSLLVLLQARPARAAAPRA